MEFKIKLSRMTQDQIRKLAEFIHIYHTNVDELIESQLIMWLRMTEPKFSDAGDCPHCYLQGDKTKLKGIPMLDAEKEGIIHIGKNTDRSLLNDMQFVICPRCMWWGHPFVQKS